MRLRCKARSSASSPAGCTRRAPACMGSNTRSTTSGSPIVRVPPKPSPQHRRPIRHRHRRRRARSRRSNNVPNNNLRSSRPPRRNRHSRAGHRHRRGRAFSEKCPPPRGGATACTHLSWVRKRLHAVVPAEAGTHTPCPLDRLRRMGPGSTAGTTEMCACRSAEAGVESGFPSENAAMQKCFAAGPSLAGQAGALPSRAN